MGFSFTDAAYSIDCPVCGKEIKKTIGWFKQNGQTCPHCGLILETTKFARGLKEAEKEIDKLRTSIKKFPG